MLIGGRRKKGTTMIHCKNFFKNMFYNSNFPDSEGAHDKPSFHYTRSREFWNQAYPRQKKATKPKLLKFVSLSFDPHIFLW